MNVIHNVFDFGTSLCKERRVFIMKPIRHLLVICGLGLLIALPINSSYALEGLSLEKAGFTIVAPSEEAEEAETLIKSIKLSELKEKPVFFVSKIQCDSACQKLLQSGKVKLIHRWVRMIGVTPKTRLKQDFPPEAFAKSPLLLKSELIIKTAGDWFVEIQLSDGKKLCLDEDEKHICEFVFQVTLE
jgi:hypothetical protein